MFNSSHALYVILDTEVISKNNLDIFKLTDTLSQCEVDMFQLRAKSLPDRDFLSLAVKLSKIIHKRKKIFIVNDRADMAYLCKADGVHLGKDDISPDSARKILGKETIIGKTIHSLEELKIFQKENIDYVSVGTVFKTQIKPALSPLGVKKLPKILKEARKTVFAIGGINLYNMFYLVKLGINNIAVCQGVILSKNLKNTVKEFKELLS